MTDDWYQRLLATGLLDVLAPYNPALVGVHPLGIAPAGAPIEVVCRAVDLPAFARVLERTYGVEEGFALYGGRLDEEEAVFAEFVLAGLPLEVSAQREHVHRRLGAATLGVSRALEQAGPVARAAVEQAVAGGQDWLDAATTHLNLSRSALESLSTANPALVARVMGVPAKALPIRDYAVALLVGVVADVLIVSVGAARGSQEYTGLLIMFEAGVLGLVFGARLGVLAALAPLLAIGLLIGSSVAIGSESCSPDCAQQTVDYLFVAVVVASAAGVTGMIRDRYFPRAA